MKFMKTKVSLLVPQLLGWLLILNHYPSTSFAQNTIFTYQGRVTDNGTNFTGIGQFKFALVTRTNSSDVTYWSNDGTSTNGSEPAAAVNLTVANGLFSAVLGDTNMLAVDSAIFSHPNLQLRIWFSDGVNGSAALDPAQNLTPAPYAVVATSLAGVIENNTVSGSGATVGGGLGNAATIDGATVGGGINNHNSGSYSTVGGGIANSVAGVTSTIAGGTQNTIGPAAINGTIAGGQANTVQAPNSTVGGGEYNTEGTNTYFATIAGGGYNYIGTNSSSTTISGGYANQIGNNTLDAVIGGGSYNTVGVNSPYSVIAGGRENDIGFNATAATVAGGYRNVAYGNYSFAAGSYAIADHSGSFVWSDASTNDYFYSTAPNEFSVRANGGVHFVTGFAGLRSDGPVQAASFQGDGFGLTNLSAAKITGSLPDTRLSANVALLNANQTFSGANTFNGVNTFNSPNTFNDFLTAGDVSLTSGSGYHRLQLSGGNAMGFLYASYPALGDGIHLSYNHYYTTGGANFISNLGGGTSRMSLGYGSIIFTTGGAGSAPNYNNLTIIGTTTTVNGTFNNNSDRNAKQNFASVNSAQILDKVLQLPLSEWSYKVDPATRHVGPMAQDFYSAFSVGTDDQHIAPLDEAGVAFAAIQGLNQKLNQKDAEIQQLKQSVVELKSVVSQLAKTERNDFKQ